jgi:DNA replicative helicase MCM subunit Mcm2 (Cdc46/Mcm family)
MIAPCCFVRRSSRVQAQADNACAHGSSIGTVEASAPACRFDILWLILDRANEDNDRKLADHVLAVHQTGAVAAPEAEHATLTPGQLRTYVAMAKQHAPKIPADLTEYVSAIYGELRRQEALSDRPNSYTTPRTLLSILRLSQALAKLRFDNAVRAPAAPLLVNYAILTAGLLRAARNSVGA